MISFRQTFKFEKQNPLNFSKQFEQDFPLECDIEFDTNDNSIMNPQDMYKKLLKVMIIPISKEFDQKLGAKQWGCYLLPNTVDALSRDDLSHFIFTIKSNLNLRIITRLRHRSIKSTSMSVPVVIGYILLMDHSSNTSLLIKESGEVVTDVRLALPMFTKRLIEEGRIVKLTVSSSRPNLVEVLAPREDGIGTGIWIYPLKAVVIDKSWFIFLLIVIS